MDRVRAIVESESYFDRGRFRDDLARRVAIPTESQDPAREGELRRYIDAELVPSLEALRFRCHAIEKAGRPILIADRIETNDFTTVLSYGHGDVVRGWTNCGAETLPLGGWLRVRAYTGVAVQQTTRASTPSI